MFGFLECAQRPVSTLPLALIVGCSFRMHFEQLLLRVDAFAVVGYRVKLNTALRSIAADNWSTYLRSAHVYAFIMCQ